MSQELTNEVQWTPSEIVRDMTGGTQIFHPATSVTEELSSELPQAVELPAPPVLVKSEFGEIPQPVPRQSTFVPNVGTWWEFVDRDPKVVYFVTSAKSDVVSVEEYACDIDSDKRRIRFLSCANDEILANDFRSGLMIECEEREIPFITQYRNFFKTGNKTKNVENKSDPERNQTVIDEVVRAIADELSVDSKHVNRLLESALEGVRNFVTLKNCVATSPAIPAFLNVLKTPEIGEILTSVMFPVIENTVRRVVDARMNLLIDSAGELLEKDIKTILEKDINSMRAELVSRRKWESGYDIFANETRDLFAKIEERFVLVDKQIAEITPDFPINTPIFPDEKTDKVLDRALKDVSLSDAVSSVINPQMNDVREQLANLFERCDAFEKKALREKQKKWTSERKKKEEREARKPEQRAAINAASRTLQERKRREKLGDELLAKGVVTPQKRGRGRPPKTAVPNEIKRGRGRPRKEK